MEDGTPEEGLDPVSLEIQRDIQLVLSALCETDLHRKVGLTRGPGAPCPAL